MEIMEVGMKMSLIVIIVLVSIIQGYPTHLRYYRRYIAKIPDFRTIQVPKKSK